MSEVATNTVANLWALNIPYWNVTICFLASCLASLPYNTTYRAVGKIDKKLNSKIPT